MAVQLRYRTLIELFEQSLARAELTEKQCLEVVTTNGQEELTFGELRSKACEFAIHLIRKRAIGVGDKVAVLGRNRVDWDVAFWGIILAGAVPVLIDPERRVEGVKNHLLHTDARMLVLADDYQPAPASPACLLPQTAKGGGGDDGSREKLRELLTGRGIDLIEMTVYEKPSLEDSHLTVLLSKIRAAIKADDTAVILCTSGTTGDPREVEITHANLIANIQGALDVVSISAADKLGHIIPPHHSFGLTVAKLLPLWVGATNLYTDKYRQISQLIKDKAVTIFVGVPAVFIVLARKIEQNLAARKEKSFLVRLADRYLPGLVGRMMVKKLGWGTLRFFLSGAAPVPKWVLEVFWKRHLELREGYGTTENSPVYGLNANRKKLGSVGRPISTLSVRIVNDRNEQLGPGRTGQIVLAGPCIMKGYYKNPKATGEVIKTDENGLRWLHTGDLGYLDEDGYLFITGRKKYLIVLPGGKNVYPELVELALSQARYVQELVVLPGYRKGPAGIKQEAVKAIVRPDWEQIQADTGLCRADLVNQPEVLKNLVWQSINKCQQANQELAAFERIPSRELVEIRIEEFEKTSTGKIKRGGYIQLENK